MSKAPQEPKAKPVTIAIAVEVFPGELYQAVLYRIQDGKVVGEERPNQKHVWGVVKDDFAQMSIDKVFPQGLE